MSGTIRALPRRGAVGPARRPLRFWWVVLLALAIVVVLAAPGLINLLITYWWFGELGYDAVFTTQLTTGVALTLVGTAVSATILKSLAYFVTRIARAQGRGQAYRGVVRLGVNAAVAVLALLTGLGLSGEWQRVLFWLRQTPFGTRDPIFHHDSAFYIFTLPLLQDLLAWVGLVLFLGLLVALVLLYTLDLGGRINQTLEPYIRTGQVIGGPSFDPRWLRPYLTVVSFWLSLVTLLIAGSNWLMRYNALVSPGDGFQGASYVDLHADIPAWTILAVLGGLIAVLLFLNAFTWRRWLFIAAAAAVWIAAWVLLVGIYPAIVQAIQVNPAPLAAESSQIGYNLGATRDAFNISQAHFTDFPAATVTQAQVAADRTGIDSLRVVDPDQFVAAAQQQQAIRTSYDFPSVGLDRYRINGQLRQVLIAARELNQSQLPDTAKTWQNLNFTYTHGYGLTLAPVNTVAADGSPFYFVRDIPPHLDPAGAGLPPVTRPQIYFGLDTTNSIFVDTNAKEFDYGTDYQENYSHYGGSAGIPIGGFLHRLAWVVYFGSPIQFGTSSYLTAGSRVLLHRAITDRLATLAPFFTYDQDPYMVLDNSGHPTWIVDGYTTSNDYPYAEPYGGDTVQSLAGITYIRNAIKVTIDPYNGTVRFYVADPTDAIVRTIGGAFPGLLHPLSAMPADLRAHLRYPEDLFNTQYDMFQRYHQTDAQTWYNNADQWATPQVGGTGSNNGPVPVASYYAVTHLPDGSGDEFVLMRPFTPLGKTNMVSLFVGRADAPHYGQLVVYRFPLGRQVLGPQQLQTNVQQKPDFSQDITLWNQQGSRVQFGNIVIVPVANGLLYVEPLYLQAENSKIPQLQRVITYINGKLVWDSTLERGLGQIFGNAAPPRSTTPQAPIVTVPGAPITGTLPITDPGRAVLQQIQAHLSAAQQAYGRGDFATYAREQAAAYRLLQQALGATR